MSESDAPQSEYPESEKLGTTEALTAISFLEYLDELNMVVAYDDDGRLRLNDSTKPSVLLYGYLNVDPVKLEAERRDMLRKIGNAN